MIKRRPLPSSDHNQGGYMVMIVGLIGSVMSIGILVFFYTTVSLERRAIEENIADMRTYWAAMGTKTYVLARALEIGACVCDIDTNTCNIAATECSSDLDRVYTLETFRNELDPPIPYDYQNIPNNYVLNTDFMPENDESAGGPNNGHIRFTATVQSVGTHPFLTSIASRLRSWEIGLCINNGGASCPATNDDLTDVMTGQTFIKFVRRQ